MRELLLKIKIVKIMKKIKTLQKSSSRNFNRMLVKFSNKFSFTNS